MTMPFGTFPDTSLRHRDAVAEPWIESTINSLICVDVDLRVVRLFGEGSGRLLDRLICVTFVHDVDKFERRGMTGVLSWIYQASCWK
ncbi:hypothetical protein Rcas_1006 [Roseiflexus castenholzii DSM 13941]|uniref:Uncharacterized protein n=1 Tax=Roseiflexus castenholzii (strain DSM 13941 / HLO8) TaxID=383372 RepID=A7NI17_ROSCS|nr:hypothetical protein Rcas_1006 [Roseiflexus castenholzii DSM 13941]